MALPGELDHDKCLECGKPLELEVLTNGNGVPYIGTFCDVDGPNSRESEYFPSIEAAQEALTRWRTGDTVAKRTTEFKGSDDMVVIPLEDLPDAASNPAATEMFEALMESMPVTDDNPLTATKVGILMGSCLHPEGTESFTTEDTVFVEAILHSYAFRRAAIEEHAEQIHEMLQQLPDDFQQKVEGEGREAGGGWSFLNMCMRRDGVQWTGLHATQELLMGLGIAAGWGTIPTPRFLWDVLPGQMPYFAVLAERAEVPAPTQEKIDELNAALAAQKEG